MVHVDPASINISKASSACLGYLESYPQRRESQDVRRWLGEIEKEKARRDENIRLEKIEQQRQLAETERLKEQERIANLPENLFAKAKSLVSINDPDAIPLLEKASRQGHADSSFELAHIYAKGFCGTVTNENAMENWLSVATQQGHVRANSMLLRRQQQTQRLDNTWRKYWDGESFSADEYLSADEIEKGRKEIAIALRECTEARSWTREQAQSFLSTIMACTMKSVDSGSRSGGPSRQTQVDTIRPSGSPPSWQVREGRTRPDGVRTFNENQYIARHEGRYGGAFATAREASLRADELNTQQGYNEEAVMAQAMYSGQDGVYMLNSRAGNWTYKYDANRNAFVVYQE